MKTRAKIGVKRMGELDNKPFVAAAKRKFSAGEADEKAAELSSLWEDCIMDPNWHPFKIIIDKEGNPTVCNHISKICCFDSVGIAGYLSS